MDKIKDSSNDRAISKNLIPDQELIISMMRRVWLDNSLNIACQDIFGLLEEITADPETYQKNLTTLCKDPSYRQTLNQEWAKKELSLERLADLLESARQQIRLERLILSEEDLSIAKDGQK